MSKRITIDLDRLALLALGLADAFLLAVVALVWVLR